MEQQEQICLKLRLAAWAAIAIHSENDDDRMLDLHQVLKDAEIYVNQLAPLLDQTNFQWKLQPHPADRPAGALSE